MGMGVLEQLIAKGRPSPITSAISGFTGTAAAIQNLRKQRLANQIQQAQAQIAPQTAQANLQKQLLANKIQQAVANLAPQSAQAGLLQAQAKPGLTKAQTQQALATAQKEQAFAKSPFLGKLLPGAAGETQGLEITKQKYGANSSQYLQALNEYHVKQNLEKARGDYYGSNVQFKYLPQTVKNQRILVYQKDMANRQKLGHPTMTFPDWLATNYPPSGDGLVHSNQPTTETPRIGSVTPASPQTISADKAVPDYAKMAEQTTGIIAKSTGDAKIRQRATAANNVLKILNNEDVGNISKFAGLEGKARYLYQAGKANIGITPSKAYLDYRLFKKSQAKAIADAARLILQTSQRGSYVYKMLQPLADPTMETWGNSPEEVKMRLNFMKHFMADYASNLSKQALTGFTPSLVKQEQTGMLQGTPAAAAAATAAAAPPTQKAPPSQEDLEYTAKVNKISVDEVKRRLRIK